MDSEAVSRYLSSLGPAEPRRETRKGPWPCVLLSRQAGAGGHTLAQELLRRFERRAEDPLFSGWQILDDSLIRKLADDPRVKVRLEALLDEGFRSGLEDWLAHLIAGTALQDDIMRKVFKFMRQAAAVGKCLIVGRGGACLLGGRPGVVSVRLVAPRELRILRIQTQKNMDCLTAARWLDRSDAQRAELVRRYFSRRIDDPLVYDLTINTATLGVGAAAAAVESLVEAAARRLSEEAVLTV